VAETEFPRPDPLTALVTGAAALARGTDLDDALGTLVGAVVASVGATSAAISLQDPDGPDPELTFTIGLDESAQAGLAAAVASADHPLTAAARDRQGRRECRQCRSVLRPSAERAHDLLMLRLELCG
jgi:hypothetical protein